MITRCNIYIVCKVLMGDFVDQNWFEEQKIKYSRKCIPLTSVRNVSTYENSRTRHPLSIGRWIDFEGTRWNIHDLLPVRKVTRMTHIRFECDAIFIQEQTRRPVWTLTWRMYVYMSGDKDHLKSVTLSLNAIRELFFMVVARSHRKLWFYLRNVR